MTGMLPAEPIVKVRARDVPPPGAGLNTVTLAVPGEAILAAGTVAVNCPVLTNVVVKAVPFHWIDAPFTKLPPFTVSVNAGPPAVAELGLMLVSNGRGLLIVKVN